MRYVEAMSSAPRERRAAAVLLAGVAVFQVSLAAGAPWGRLAWGGRHDGVLPPTLRVSSAGAAAVWGAAAVAVATQRPRSARGQVLLLRGVGGVCAVGSALNLASPSPAERLLWTPVSAALAVLSWRASSSPVSGR